MKNIQHLLENSSTQFRILISAFAGFCGFGLWAYWVNSEYGNFLAIKAAVTQGGYSFVVTFLNTYLIEFIFRCLNKKSFQIFITAILASLVVCSLSWCLNTILGTPEVFMTILPGCIISSVYCFVYTLTLKKLTI